MNPWIIALSFAACFCLSLFGLMLFIANPLINRHLRRISIQRKTAPEDCDAQLERESEIRQRLAFFRRNDSILKSLALWTGALLVLAALYSLAVIGKALLVDQSPFIWHTYIREMTIPFMALLYLLCAFSIIHDLERGHLD